MNLDALAASFAAELDRRTPLVDGEAVWPSARLRDRLFVGDHDFPAELLASARAVVFKASKVVVVDEIHGERHIEPGGGLEPGETVEQTVRREVAEECGWTIGELTLLGFHFLEPLTQPRPHPTRRWGPMVHAIFVTEGLRYNRAAKDMNQIETGSRLTPISRALVELRPDQATLLRAAIARRAQP